MLATWHHQFSINIKFLRSFNQHDGIRISYQEHEEYQNTDDENKLNIISLMYWFQTKLYTRVQVNVTKRMKEVTILRCMFLHRHLVFFWKQSAYYAQHPFKNAVGWFFIPMLTEKCAPPFCQFYFWFGPSPKNMYLFVELSFFGFVSVNTRVIRVRK